MKRNFKNWVTIMALVGMALITIANIQWQSTDKANKKTIQAQQLRIEQLETQLAEHKKAVTVTPEPVIEYKTITKTNTVEKENALETATRALLAQGYKRMSQDMYNHVIEYHENGNLEYGNEIEGDEELYELLELYGYSMNVTDLVNNVK